LNPLTEITAEQALAFAKGEAEGVLRELVRQELARAWRPAVRQRIAEVLGVPTTCADPVPDAPPPKSPNPWSHLAVDGAVRASIAKTFVPGKDGRREAQLADVVGGLDMAIGVVAHDLPEDAVTALLRLGYRRVVDGSGRPTWRFAEEAQPARVARETEAAADA
jgi:hypothetical protein